MKSLIIGKETSIERPRFDQFSAERVDRLYSCLTLLALSATILKEATHERQCLERISKAIVADQKFPACLIVDIDIKQLRLETTTAAHHSAKTTSNGLGSWLTLESSVRTLAQVVESGQAKVFSFTEPDQVDQQPTQEFKSQSTGVMILPLVVHGQVGVLALVSTNQHEPFIAEEVAAFTTLAANVSSTLTGLRRIREYERQTLAYQETQQKFDAIEPKQQEKSIHDGARLLRSILDLAPVMIFAKDQDGRFLLANKELADAYKLEPAQLVGLRHADVHQSPAEIECFTATDLKVMATKQPIYNLINTFTESSGRRRILQTSMIPITWPDSLSQAILGVAVDITELKLAEAENQRINNELEQRVASRTRELLAVNQELESFCYTVSHDLQNPLRAIDGFSSLLLEQIAPTLDAENRYMLTQIKHKSQQMMQLIADLLTFSRMSRKVIAINTIKMKELFETVIHEVTALRRQPCEFIVHSLPPAHGDCRMIHQVISNLVSNAVKYTSRIPNPRIEIGWLSVGDHGAYYVKDNGAGYNMQYQEKLFRVFERLHPEDEFEGTGVGLAIVKRIIERHGGRVWSEGVVGQGATFYFMLPQQAEA